MEDVPITFGGPTGEITETVLLDSGASETLIPIPIAQQLGLKPYTVTPVTTADGPKRYPTAMIDVSEPGGEPQQVPAYITPLDSVLALGRSGARALGFKIETPGGRNIALAAQGAPTQSLQEARLTECFLCDQRVDSDAFGPACAACGGCQLVKKAANPAAACPKGKW